MSQVCVVVGDEVCFQPQRQILVTTIITVPARNYAFDSTFDLLLNCFTLLYVAALSS